MHVLDVGVAVTNTCTRGVNTALLTFSYTFCLDCSLKIASVSCPFIMRYYKPLLFSAVTIIYASLASRVLRVGMVSRAISQRTNAKS